MKERETVREGRERDKVRERGGLRETDSENDMF